MDVKLNTVTISDEQTQLTNKINYNFHLLADYINQVKGIEGPRGKQGLPGIQGPRGFRGEKGEGLFYCPMDYPKTEEEWEAFSDWVYEIFGDEGVPDGSVIVFKDGTIATTKDNTIDQNSTIVNINSVVKDAVKESTENTLFFWEKTSENGQTGLYPSMYSYDTKIGSPSDNGGILLDQYIEKNPDVDSVFKHYISMYSHESISGEYNPKWFESTSLNGLYFGINESSYSDNLNNSMQIMFSSFNQSDNALNFLNEGLIHIGKIDVDSTVNICDSGLRIINENTSISNDISCVIGSGIYNNALNSIISSGYINVISLYDEGDSNRYLSIGYGDFFNNSGENNTLINSSSNIIIRTNNMIQSRNDDMSMNVLFYNENKNHSLNIYPMSLDGSTKSYTDLSLLGSENGGRVYITGGSITNPDNSSDIFDVDDSTYGSVIIKGGVYNYPYAISDDSRAYNGGMLCLYGGDKYAADPKATGKYQGGIYIKSNGSAKDNPKKVSNNSIYLESSTLDLYSYFLNIRSTKISVFNKNSGTLELTSSIQTGVNSDINSNFGITFKNISSSDEFGYSKRTPYNIGGKLLTLRQELYDADLDYAKDCPFIDFVRPDIEENTSDYRYPTIDLNRNVNVGYISSYQYYQGANYRIKDIYKDSDGEYIGSSQYATSYGLDVHSNYLRCFGESELILTSNSKITFKVGNQEMTLDPGGITMNSGGFVINNTQYGKVTAKFKHFWVNNNSQEYITYFPGDTQEYTDDHVDKDNCSKYSTFKCTNSNLSDMNYREPTVSMDGSILTVKWLEKLYDKISSNSGSWPSYVDITSEFEIQFKFEMDNKFTKEFNVSKKPSTASNTTGAGYGKVTDVNQKITISGKSDSNMLTIKLTHGGKRTKCKQMDILNVVMLNKETFNVDVDNDKFV